MREERRLAPTRSKPSYLRRKPETGARPGWQGQADGGERPLKRRRIFDEGSAEAPKVEFVAEKPHFQKRGEGAGERTGDRPERPPFRSRGTGDGPDANRVSRGATRVRAGVPRGRRTAAVEPARVQGNRVSRGATRVRAGVPRGHRSAAVELARVRGNRVFRGATRAQAGVPRGRRSAAEEPARVRGNRVFRGATRVRAGVQRAFRSRGAGDDDGIAFSEARRGRGRASKAALPQPWNRRWFGEPRFQKRDEGAGDRPERPPFRSREGGHEGGHKPRFERRSEGAGERTERPPFRSRGGDEGAREAAL